MTLLDASLRRLGIEGLGEVPWGTHFCLFYTTKEDLLDLLVPYFKTALENHEFCLWVAATPLEVQEARQAMSEKVPDFERYETEGQIEFVTHTGWYLSGGNFDAQRVIEMWIDKLNQALAKGYAGMRSMGNTFWLEKHHWKSFAEYEAELESGLSDL